MNIIKTFEGFFDFFKSSMKSKVEACKEFLKGRDYQMNADENSEFIFTYPYIVHDKECKVKIVIVIGDSKNLPNLTITGMIPTPGIPKVIYRDLRAILRINTVHFIDILKSSIKNCEERIKMAVEAEEFFLDYPQEDIEDYLVDLKDEVINDIRIRKNYYESCWDITFSITGIKNSSEYKNTKKLVYSQVSELSDLLDRVGLSLVDKSSIVKVREHEFCTEYACFFQILKKN
jgi:hypothetical protein